MLSRREFLRLTTMAGAGLLVPSVPLWGCGDEAGTELAPETNQTVTQRILKPPSQLDRFIDPLPIPQVLKPDADRYEDTDYYEVRMSQFAQETHSQLPETTVWGFEGSSPGPVIEARKDRPVRVKWINDEMPTRHLLETSIDQSLFRGEKMPDVRTIAHLHGGHTPPQFDGHPDAWSTPGADQSGRRYTKEDFLYPNNQPACALWYHDHAMSITRLNVYAGLAGLYLIRDETEDSLGLPAGNFELPLVIQDRSFNDNGSLSYPTQGLTAEHPAWVHFFFGEIPVINGKAYPYLEVEPRRYRFRLLNGSQSRVYNLWFEARANRQGNAATGAAVQGPFPFHMIGSDGGLLPRAVPLEKLTLGPAERADLIIDFSNLGEGTLTLRNDAAAPFPTGGGGPPITELMQIRVSKTLEGKDESTPAESLKLPPLPELAPTPGIPARVIDLDVLLKGNETSAFQINNRFFRDPVEEKPANGTTEVWEFVNLTADAHPMHVHLVQFRILNRQPMDGQGYFKARDEFFAGAGPRPDPGNYIVGPPVPPPPHESGWKDTALAMPNEVLRILAPFNLPPLTSRPASYIYHCHILEHEDNEMMRPFEVV